MSGPSGVCDRNLLNICPLLVDGALFDEFLQTSDLAYMLEQEHLALFVSVDTEASRVISTVFLASETLNQNIADGLTILKRVSGVRSDAMVSEQIVDEHEKREISPFRGESCNKRRFHTF